MSFYYVRNHYNVPAKRGARVAYHGKPGTVVGATHYVHVRLDGEGFAKPYHPKDEGLVWLASLPKEP
jgi:hypothetical protein